MKVAIIGAQGIPNNYGGFEALAEYLAKYLSNELDLTIFCSSIDLKTNYKFFENAKLRYIHISSHGTKGILYDSLSLLKAIKEYDKILLLGFGGGFIIPLLKKYRHKIIVNIGGLDWTRSKWSSLTRKAIKKAEKNLMKNADTIVADNIGIQKYISDEYKKKGILIAYGGDQAKKKLPDQQLKNKYSFLSKPYAFCVTRIQPDNNIEMILNAFVDQENLPLVMVGNWDGSKYGKKIKNIFTGLKSLILIDAIYDRSILDVLRSNCKIYIHGHSAGGTNPSLVEAMHLELPILAFASGYNEYTTENKAIYFQNQHELSQIILNINKFNLKKIGSELTEIAKRKYTWALISQQYKEVFLANNI